MEAITSAVHELASRNVRVLSPADPRIVASQGEFLFVASDPIRSVRLVQDRHRDCIRASSFLWLVCPDGYVGVSAAMEISTANDADVPIFATRAPNDITLREYVIVVASLSEALTRAQKTKPARSLRGILIDPHASIEKAHITLEQVRSLLTRPTRTDPAARIYRNLEELRTLIAAPAYTQ